MLAISCRAAILPRHSPPSANNREVPMPVILFSRSLRQFVAIMAVIACANSVCVARAADENEKRFTQMSEVMPSTTDASQQTDAFILQPGFQVERLFTVPKEKLGSWVAITFDNKGRLIASDQGALGLCRITPARLGSKDLTTVEKLDVNITSAQGLLFAFGSLYLSVNGGPGSGLYRAQDTDGDDQFDKVEKLKEIGGGGEHGPHALRLSPDGKSIYLIGGNHTKTPFDRKLNGEVQTMGGVRPDQLKAELPDWASSRIVPNWDEDTLLPRQWDGNGHATGILAPGGWIAKTDPEGKTWEIVSIGYRNQYDMDFNHDGELFAYDSDMEWDLGMPWYRPTRVNHATDGSDFGWRSGTPNPPSYFVDSLPPMIDIGPGSPVGVAFGYGTKFPAKYQKALYICDWTFGTMYALHLTPNGSTYSATKEHFVARTPLPLTDVEPGPDGALYFTVGGRGTQSELFRVTYTGNEATARVDYHDQEGVEARALRHKIETYHKRVDDQAAAAKFLIPYLGNSDRFIRFAARVGLEFQEPSYWLNQVLASDDPQVVINGAVAAAHVAERSAAADVFAGLARLDAAKLNQSLQLDLLRAWQLAFVRLGEPDSDLGARLVAQFDPLFPAKNDDLNRELCTLLVFLKSPTVVEKTIALMKEPARVENDLGLDVMARNANYGGTIKKMLENRPETQKIHYAFTLRNVKDGFTPEQRNFYFQWLQDARSKTGGASYQNFLKNIDNDAFANTPELQRLALSASGVRKVYSQPELPKAKGPGKDWTLADLIAMKDSLESGRNFNNGKRSFAAARCVVCHRFAGEGGATGPDLTQLAGRFNLKDLSEAIVDPSKVVSDQYRGVIVQTADGKTYNGRIVGEGTETITMLVDPEDPSKLVTIKKKDVEEKLPAPQSLMPKDLLKQLNESEVQDLMAYLLSRGNERDRAFKKPEGQKGGKAAALPTPKEPNLKRVK
jgi:putative heme-binding domain-containing protein